MGRNSYQTCRLILQQLRSRGFHSEIPIPEVVKVIRIVAGADERTVEKYSHLLEEFGFLKRINLRVARIVE